MEVLSSVSNTAMFTAVHVRCVPDVHVERMPMGDAQAILSRPMIIADRKK